MREAEEDARLAPAGTRSSASRGRRREEPPDDYRTPFERDRDRVLHSKAFRRLKHKTQVFVNPDGDHYVTRLTHVLQVTQVARALAAGLGLNETLAEAIALAHDVGHTPFGHTGEEALTEYFEGGWHHSEQSLRVFEVLEDLNLTWEVRDGIRGHPWRVAPPPATPEGVCARYADRVAYLSHDALDAIRAELLRSEEIPASVRDRWGKPGSGWIGTMIHALIDHSLSVGRVEMEPETVALMGELRDFMFERVYLSPYNQPRRQAALTVVRHLMDYYLANEAELPEGYAEDDAPLVQRVADYVSGMTDRFALATHDRLFRPVLFLEPSRSL